VAAENLGQLAKSVALERTRQLKLSVSQKCLFMMLLYYEKVVFYDNDNDDGGGDDDDDDDDDR